MSGRFAGPSRRPRPSKFEAELITRLRELPAGPAPRPVFKSELRAQLVSITSRIVAESAPSTAEAATGGPVRHPRRWAPSGALRALRRPALTFAAAAAVLVVLLGAAVWMSSGSLPGDSLYGLKRASENVKLSLADGNVDKGNTYLKFASRRATEAARLLPKPAPAATGSPTAVGPVSDRTAKLVTDTLNSADSDSRSGTQLLGRQAVADMSADPLNSLRPWTVAQHALLMDVKSRAPAGALQARVDQSLALLDRIAKRSQALRAEIGCPCLAQSVSDDLGPLPCSPCKSLGSVPGGGGSPSPGATGSGGSTPRGGSPSGGNHSASSGVTGSSGTGSSNTGGAAGSGGGGGGGAGSGNGSGGVGGLLPSGVPPLPTPGGTGVPSLPVSIGSSGVGVSVPGGSVGVGSSGVHVSLPVGPSLPIPGLVGGH